MASARFGLLGVVALLLLCVGVKGLTPLSSHRTLYNNGNGGDRFGSLVSLARGRADGIGVAASERGVNIFGPAAFDDSLSSPVEVHKVEIRPGNGVITDLSLSPGGSSLVVGFAKGDVWLYSYDTDVYAYAESVDDEYYDAGIPVLSPQNGYEPELELVDVTSVRNEGDLLVGVEDGECFVTSRRSVPPWSERTPVPNATSPATIARIDDTTIMCAGPDGVSLHSIGPAERVPTLVRSWTNLSDVRFAELDPVDVTVVSGNTTLTFLPRQGNMMPRSPERLARELGDDARISSMVSTFDQVLIGVRETGSAYLLTKDDVPLWQGALSLSAPEASTSVGFATALDIAAGFIVVGAPRATGSDKAKATDTGYLVTFCTADSSVCEDLSNDVLLYIGLAIGAYFFCVLLVCACWCKCCVLGPAAKQRRKRAERKARAKDDEASLEAALDASWGMSQGRTGSRVDQAATADAQEVEAASARPSVDGGTATSSGSVGRHSLDGPTARANGAVAGGTNSATSSASSTSFANSGAVELRRLAASGAGDGSSTVQPYDHPDSTAMRMRSTRVDRGGAGEAGGAAAPAAAAGKGTSAWTTSKGTSSREELALGGNATPTSYVLPRRRRGGRQRRRLARSPSGSPGTSGAAVPTVEPLPSSSDADLPPPRPPKRSTRKTSAVTVTSPTPPLAGPSLLPVPVGSASGSTSSKSLSRSASLSPAGSSLAIEPTSLLFRRKIGEGAFGEVHLAEWHDMRVVVKKFKSTGSPSGDAEARRQMHREAAQLADLKPHINLVTFMGIVEEPLSIVLQYCEQGSLLDALYGSRVRALSASAAAKICKGIARGVAHLHAERVIHRDLAARNVLLDGDNVAKVTDFGMSRHALVTDRVGDAASFTTYSSVGPVLWMAPECMRDRKVHFAGDVWSFGVCLYEVYAREMPWKGESVMGAGFRVLQGEHVPIPPLTPATPRQVMSRCFAYAPADRPTMREVVQALDGPHWDFATTGDSSTLQAEGAPEGGASSLPDTPPSTVEYMDEPDLLLSQVDSYETEMKQE